MTDKKQIGLTKLGSEALAQLMNRDLFAAESDAYKFGISYALAMGLDPASGGTYKTKFNAAGGIDVYGEIRDLIAILRPQDASRPYAIAERLAEAGIRAVAERVANEESLADILNELEEEDSDG